MEDRVKELNHKLREKAENLHTWKSATTSTTLSIGPGTNVATTPAIANEGWVFNSFHHVRDFSVMNTVRFNWQESPSKHPEVKVESKLTIFCGAPQSNILRCIIGTAGPWSAYPTRKSLLPPLLMERQYRQVKLYFLILMPSAWSLKEREKYNKFQQWRSCEAKNGIVKQNENMIS